MTLVLYLIAMYLETSLFESQVTERDMVCMVSNLWHESRSEDLVGNVLVAQTVMNRVKHRDYPSTPCRVIYQPNQFSWTSDGISDDVVPMTKSDIKRLQDIIYVAGAALDGSFDYIHRSLDYYAHDKVTPCWATAFDGAYVYGNHTWVFDPNENTPCWDIKQYKLKAQKIATLP